MRAAFRRACLLAALVSLLVPGPASGVSLREKRDELRSLKQNLKVGQQQLNAIRQQETSATQELSQIQQNLDVATTRLNDTQYRYFLVQRKVSETARQLQDAGRKLEEQQRYARARLRSLWKYGQMDNVALLLNAADLGSFLQRVQFLQYVSAQDARMINSLLQQRQKIAHLQHQQVVHQQEIAKVSQAIAQQRTQLTAQQDAQTKYVAQLRAHRWMVEREINRLAEASHQIEGLIRRLTWSFNSHFHFHYGGGRLLWPLPGHTEVSSGFGYREHPLFHVHMFHTGWDIPAEAGTPILCAHNGEVLYSGWYGGYGKVVIVDHGGGIATLYGHTSVDYVQAGQKVKRGQVIAAVGSTGFSTGPHLHFEVRKDGTPVNPGGWL